jgi:hypothetical protein
LESPILSKRSRRRVLLLLVLAISSLIAVMASARDGDAAARMPAHFERPALIQRGF